MTVTRLTVEEINKYADDVYLKAKQGLGDTDTVSFDVLGFVQKLGGSVSKTCGGTIIQKVCVSPDGGRFHAQIPMFMSASWDRFAVAHCLYHFLIEYVSSGKTVTKFELCTEWGNPERDRNSERAADLFALALLMPHSRFVPLFNELGGRKSARVLADTFKVSVYLVNTRINMLKNIGEI